MQHSAKLVLAISLAAALGASGASAEDKKKGAGDTNFDDLFGTSEPAKNNLDAMKKATEGVSKKSTSNGLAPKEDEVDDKAGVQILKAFAAEKIVQDKKLGCQPGGRDKKKLTEWTFDDIPAKANQGFEVCVTLASKAGREMNMRVSIVDARNQRIAKGDDVIDFRGRPKIDHVLEYPAPVFKSDGQYFYVVDLDGKEVGRLPLFVVKLTGQASAPAAAGTAKITDGEPDESR